MVLPKCGPASEVCPDGARWWLVCTKLRLTSGQGLVRLNSDLRCRGRGRREVRSCISGLVLQLQVMSCDSLVWYRSSPVLHLTTSDGTARIASIYFHNAKTLFNPIKVVQDSIYIYASLTILLHVDSCLLYSCRRLHE
jgi:hypothetical protein